MSTERGRRSNKTDRPHTYKNKFPRITENYKLYVATTYEEQLHKGKRREKIIRELSNQYGRSERQIERYIRDGRRLKDVRRRAEAKSVVKELVDEVSNVERQIDQFIIKAREEHLLELHKLIEEWNSHIEHLWFGIAHIKEYTWLGDIEFSSGDDEGWLYSTFYDEDGIKPIVYSLKEHLPYEDLWQNFECLWKECDMYYNYYSKLIQEIGRTVDTWGIKTEKDFLEPIFHQILRLQPIGDSLPDYTHIEWNRSSRGSLLIIDLKNRIGRYFDQKPSIFYR